MSNQLLVEGEVVFDEMGSSFTNATAYIRLEDTSRADAASGIVAEQVIQNVSHQTGAPDKLQISLYGQPPDEKAAYTVSVHIDVDRDKHISQGDYINMQSYPVLTFGHSNYICIVVRQVK